VQACPPEVPAAGAAGARRRRIILRWLQWRRGRAVAGDLMAAVALADARLMVMNLTRRLGSYSVQDAVVT